MTEAQMKRRVLAWQSRLALLGVGHWHVAQVSLSHSPPEDTSSTTSASVHTSHDYDRAWFWFDKGWVEDASDDDIDETIVHEWLHVAMRDFDEAVKLDSMSCLIPYYTSRMWEDQVKHEREGLVERLALLIVHAFRESGTL